MKTLFLFPVLLASFSGFAQTRPAKYFTLDGVYKSKSPCADCEGIETTLTLRCAYPCQSGTYWLEDIYFESPQGNVVNKVKGSWKVFEKNDDNTMVIVLNKEKSLNSSYFFVKRNGDLQPLDKDRHVVEVPYDITFRKQK